MAQRGPGGRAGRAHLRPPSAVAARGAPSQKWVCGEEGGDGGPTPAHCQADPLTPSFREASSSVSTFCSFILASTASIRRAAEGIWRNSAEIKQSHAYKPAPMLVPMHSSCPPPPPAEASQTGVAAHFGCQTRMLKPSEVHAPTPGGIGGWGVHNPHRLAAPWRVRVLGPAPGPGKCKLRHLGRRLDAGR